MSGEIFSEILKVCQRHADRLIWAKHRLDGHIPFSAKSLTCLTDMELAILDQFMARFAKLLIFDKVKGFSMRYV